VRDPGSGEGAPQEEPADERAILSPPADLAGVASPFADTRERGKRWFLGLLLVVQVLWLSAIAYGLYRLG
jgi:hypothetical protein